MQGFTGDLPPGDAHECKEYEEGHQPRPWSMAECDNRGIERDAAGSAKQKWPEFAEEIRCFRGADFVAPESTKGFTTESSGLLSGGTANSQQQPFDAVVDAIDVVFVDVLLMCPAIAVFTKFADETAFDEVELVAKNVVPVIPHEDQKGLGIPGLNVGASLLIFGQQFIRNAASHIRPKADGENFECVGNGIDHGIDSLRQKLRRAENVGAFEGLWPCRGAGSQQVFQE